MQHENMTVIGCLLARGSRHALKMSSHSNCCIDLSTDSFFFLSYYYSFFSSFFHTFNSIKQIFDRLIEVRSLDRSVQRQLFYFGPKKINEQKPKTKKKTKKKLHRIVEKVNNKVLRQTCNGLGSVPFTFGSF